MLNPVSCEYGRLLLLAVVPAGLDPLRPLGGLDDGEGPPGGEVEDQHANGDILCNIESKEEGVKGGEHSNIKNHMVAKGVYRTVPATPGLVISELFCSITFIFK